VEAGSLILLYDLWSLQEKGYGINMSGVMIRDKKMARRFF